MTGPKLLLKRMLLNIAHKTGYTVKRTKSLADNKLEIAIDMDPNFSRIYRRVKPHTVTGMDELYALYQATRYVSNNDIPGDFVECGVYNGGSSMAAALTLMHLKSTSRKLYLYDTYAGMPEPSEIDQDPRYLEPDGTLSQHWVDYHSHDIWQRAQRNDHNAWMYASLADVKRNIYSTGYPESQCEFIKGKVEDTIPARIPDSISILRLDTDFYNSTYHELIHLFPLLSPAGVLIIDDYGCFMGCRKATDKYFAENNIAILLNRITWSTRIAIKSM